MEKGKPSTIGLMLRLTCATAAAIALVLYLQGYSWLRSVDRLIVVLFVFLLGFLCVPYIASRHADRTASPPQRQNHAEPKDESVP